MNFDTIRVTTDEIGVSTLTLARPDKHNAMSGQMIASLRPPPNCSPMTTRCERWC